MRETSVKDAAQGGWVSEFAPAKVNLALHVTGQRGDGYHLLDSLVCFASVGDRIRLRPASQMSLRVNGPYRMGVPEDASNLVWKAAELIGTPPVEIELEKNLPNAAGIGGGSADAAAVLRALSVLFEQELPRLDEIVALGADVPACLSSAPSRMRGIGETTRPANIEGNPRLLLVNPGVGVPTPQVFARLANKTNSPLDDPFPTLGGNGWIDWLGNQRNDLEHPAIGICPTIGEVLNSLRALPGCQLARMSGSGATCFALLDAGADVTELTRAHPDWWIVDTHILGA